MAIRTIHFTVSGDGISPATKQAAGVQGDHRCSAVAFTIDEALYQRIREEAAEQTGQAIYRVDGYDAQGGVSRSNPQPLIPADATEEQPVIEYYLEEWLTRYGGDIKIVLVLSIMTNDTTEVEMYSFPALLQLKNLPDAADTSGENYESLSVLAEVAKTSADKAVEAQGKTELARYAIENGSTVIFDGNGTFGEVNPLFVVDETLSEGSGNAIANKSVAQKFNTLDGSISDIENDVKNLKLSDNNINASIDNFNSSLSNLEKFVSDIAKRPYIVESGSSGIWTYRKLSDGTVECWGKHTAKSISISTSGRGSYYHSMDIPIPENLFLDNPQANANANLSAGFCYVGIAGTYTSKITVILVSQESMSNVTCVTHIALNGKWK